MIIVKHTGYYDLHGENRFALLREGDALTVIRRDGDKIICTATCHNSGREVIVEVEADNAG